MDKCKGCGEPKPSDKVCDGCSQCGDCCKCKK